MGFLREAVASVCFEYETGLLQCGLMKLARQMNHHAIF